jgi:hypothetical protein
VSDELILVLGGLLMLLVVVGGAFWADWIYTQNRRRKTWESMSREEQWDYAERKGTTVPTIRRKLYGRTPTIEELERQNQVLRAGRWLTLMGFLNRRR